MNNNTDQWYSEWFDSPYYHILYHHRDKEEAAFFIDNLSRTLNFKEGEKALDIPCGRGRHAMYLSQKGLDVTGLDLSSASITWAQRECVNEKLKFFLHDMRLPYATEAFNYVLNLFTSFGYFEEEDDDKKTMASFTQALKPGGKLVLDFMNTRKAARDLVKDEERERKGILFRINRKIEKNFFVKEISFQHEGKEFFFRENVKALYMEDFIKYFNFTGLKLESLYGDYALNPYSEDSSERMIFILHKPL